MKMKPYATTRLGFVEPETMTAIIWIVFPILKHGQVTPWMSCFIQRTPSRPTKGFWVSIGGTLEGTID